MVRECLGFWTPLDLGGEREVVELGGEHDVYAFQTSLLNLSLSGNPESVLYSNGGEGSPSGFGAREGWT